jgi:uncharacterized protein (TIGR00725 family)
MKSHILIAVIGAGECDDKTYAIAEQLGRELARRGAAIVCGGLAGVMEAVCKGAKDGGGMTVGVLPGTTGRDANPYVDIPLVTGMGEARNVIVVRSGRAVIAVGGELGTLGEIAFALKFGIPVIGLGTWDIPGIIKAKDVEDAVELAIRHLQLR